MLRLAALLLATFFFALIQANPAPCSAAQATTSTHKASTTTAASRKLYLAPTTTSGFTTSVRPSSSASAGPSPVAVATYTALAVPNGVGPAGFFTGPPLPDDFYTHTTGTRTKAKTLEMTWFYDTSPVCPLETLKMTEREEEHQGVGLAQDFLNKHGGLRRWCGRKLTLRNPSNSSSPSFTYTVTRACVSGGCIGTGREKGTSEAVGLNLVQHFMTLAPAWGLKLSLGSFLPFPIEYSFEEK
ncbi:hypothetical protein JCM8097_001118 [Rhodosporidiobolus ruineniae]